MLVMQLLVMLVMHVMLVMPQLVVMVVMPQPVMPQLPAMLVLQAGGSQCSQLSPFIRFKAVYYLLCSHMAASNEGSLLP